MEIFRDHFLGQAGLKLTEEYRKHTSEPVRFKGPDMRPVRL